MHRSGVMLFTVSSARLINKARGSGLVREGHDLPRVWCSPGGISCTAARAPPAGSKAGFCHEVGDQEGCSSSVDNKRILTPNGTKTTARSGSGKWAHEMQVTAQGFLQVRVCGAGLHCNR